MDPWYIIGWTIIGVVAFALTRQHLARALWFARWSISKNQQPKAGQLWRSIDTEYQITNVFEHHLILEWFGPSAKHHTPVRLADWPDFVRWHRIIPM